MQEENRDRGLVLIGMHIEKNRSRDEVIESCRRHDLNFPVYIDGYIGAIYVKGTPQAYVFDHEGKIVYDGTTLESLEAAVGKALAAAPDWIAGPREYRKVAREASQVRSRREFGAVAASLRKIVASDDPEAADEALELLSRLEKHAARLMRRAEGFVGSGEPDRALLMWDSVAKMFAGDKLGNDALESARSRKKDPAFESELGAFKMLQAMLAISGKISPLRRGQDPEDWKRKNAAELNALKTAFARMEKKYAGTKVLERARGVMKSLGIG